VNSTRQIRCAGGIRRAIAVVCMAAFGALGAVACSDSGDTSSDAGGADGEVTDVDGSSDAETETGMEGSDVLECEAGEIVECGEENTQSLLVCQEDGTGTEPASCPPDTVCREGSCVEVTCIPGRGKCEGDVPKVCNEAGEEYVEREPCGEAETCRRGSCLNRCQNAAESNSYIGCEYWAVELENNLLFEERESGQSIPNDQLPPYAIVLANTSSQFDANVTVRKKAGAAEDGDPFAKAIGSRTVGTDIQQPGLVKETVESELLNEQGQRLLGPEDLDGRSLRRVPLPSNSLLTLILPNRQIPDGKSTLSERAYKVESSQPIVAYQFNPYCCNYNFTNDASLLLPRSALSENYMYMSYPVWDAPNRSEGDESQAANITVLATEPETEVTVDLREPSSEDLSYRDILHPPEGERIGQPDDEGRISVTMDPFEVLNIAGSRVGEDFTGARIRSSKPVSTFGTHSCAYVPFSKPACDHLEQQLLPMETWGSKFVATPLKRRGPEGEFTREGTYWKFLAFREGTRIETGLDLRVGRDGVLPPAGEGTEACSEFSDDPQSGAFELNAGESCEFGTQTTFRASSSDPILLGAFLSGQESVGEDVSQAGDPAFFLVPPEKQYRDRYSFLTPETFFVNWVTVMVDSATEAVLLDGERIVLDELEHFREFSELGVARAHIEVEEGPHTIRAADNRDFSFISYGYDDFVSYAYTGGLDLAKQNEIE